VSDGRLAARTPGASWISWTPAALWMILIFLLSSRPSVPLPSVTHLDKLAHFGAYAILGSFLAWGQRRTGVLSPVWMVAIGIAYGASDEFHQSFVPGRSAELGDWIADSLGVIVGVAGFHLWRRGRRGADPATGRRSNTTSLPHE
jgi:VanZ family protein